MSAADTNKEKDKQPAASASGSGGSGGAPTNNKRKSTAEATPAADGKAAGSGSGGGDAAPVAAAANANANAGPAHPLGDEFISRFEAVYRETCVRTHDTPEWARQYAILDRVWNVYLPIRYSFEIAPVPVAAASSSGDQKKPVAAAAGGDSKADAGSAAAPAPAANQEQPSGEARKKLDPFGYKSPQFLYHSLVDDRIIIVLPAEVPLKQHTSELEVLDSISDDHRFGISADELKQAAKLLCAEYFDDMLNTGGRAYMSSPGLDRHRIVLLLLLSVEVIREGMHIPPKTDTAPFKHSFGTSTAELLRWLIRRYERIIGFGSWAAFEQQYKT